jgi:outer membrane translocation and assembly module TamA
VDRCYESLSAPTMTGGRPGALAFLLTLLALAGCSSLPPGQTAVDDVTVRGADGISAAKVENALSTEASPKFLGVFRGLVYDYEIFNRATMQRDLARVERYYRARGYYSAHARAGRVISTGPNHVRIEIIVEEGPPTVNAEVVVDGIEKLTPKDQATVRTASRLALVKGSRYDEELANNCENDTRRALGDLGYAYVDLKRDTFIDIVRHVARTTLTITTGETARFGAITIDGLDPDGPGPRKAEIPEAPLRRAIDIKEGDPYSSTRIDDATQALLDLGVFAAATLTPDRSNPASRVIPIRVHVEPSKLRELTLGGGLEFDELKTELHAIFGYENHDLLGGLRTFTVQFQPGVVFYPTTLDNITLPDHFFPEEKLRAEFKQPGFLEARTEAFFRPELNVFPLLVENNPQPSDPVVGYIEAKAALGVNRTFWKKLYVSLSYDAQIEHPFAYKDVLDPDLNTLIILYPELITRLDLRDNPNHPHSGIYVSNIFQIAGGFFGGETHDIKIQPEARAYVPITPKVTFATRAALGFLFPQSPQPYVDVVPKELNDPVTAANRAERVEGIQTVLFRGLFSGGPTSNRGFPIRGVSPHGIVPFLNPSTASQQVALDCNAPPGDKNPASFVPKDANLCSVPIGGFTLWEFSNEFRFDIKGPLSAATFCDMGDVSPHILGQGQAFRLNHLHLSCGVGVRYDTPVGPIRLDIGYRIQPLQVIGYKNEIAAFNADPSNGLQPTFFGGTSYDGIPVAIAIGIGEAY